MLLMRVQNDIKIYSRVDDVENGVKLLKRITCVYNDEELPGLHYSKMTVDLIHYKNISPK